MNKKIVLKVIREILEETFIGLTMPTEKPIVKQKKLSEEAYEKTPIVYHPRVLIDKK